MMKSSLILLGMLSISACANPTSDKSTTEMVATTTTEQQKTFRVPEGYKTAYFASGCFWCVEAIFEEVKGVSEVVNGYSGGHTQNPTYADNNTGTTGHAESVKVIYNPTEIDYATLVDVYFGSQNPTQVNGQGPDHGSQYRSLIFYQTPEEKSIAEAKKAALSKELGQDVAAEVIPYKRFWQAEDYHQDYEKNHPDNPYIKSVSLPRIHRFEAKFPNLLK